MTSGNQNLKTDLLSVEEEAVRHCRLDLLLKLRVVYTLTEQKCPESRDIRLSNIYYIIAAEYCENLGDDPYPTVISIGLQSFSLDPCYSIYS